MANTLGNSLLRLLFDPGSRVFMPFLAAGLGIAMIVMVAEQKRKLADRERLISRETWISRSAINDYGLILINGLLISTVLAPLMLNGGAVTSWLAQNAPRIGTDPAWWAGGALTLALFVADDFARYIGHYLEHRIPALWELHKVHHSAEVLNFATAERHHPLSIVYFRLLDGMMIALVNLGFLIVFQEQLTVALLLGGNVFWVAINMAGGVLRHSPVWVSFGPKVERWLISPAQHQIHHSTDPRHFDRNFGGSLAIWDRMFGTLYTTTPNRERIEYGLGVETRAFRSLPSLYAQPLINIWRTLRPIVPATSS